MSDVFVFSASPMASAPSEPMVFNVKEVDGKVSLKHVLCYLLMINLVSDVFVFSASPMTLAPSEPILFTGRAIKFFCSTVTFYCPMSSLLVVYV